jgi:hypothetical protein
LVHPRKEHESRAGYERFLTVRGNFFKKEEDIMSRIGKQKQVRSVFPKSAIDLTSPSDTSLISPFFILISVVTRR